MLRCTSRTPFFLCVVLLLLPTLATAEITPETLLVQMRDGVSLSTDVYRSADWTTGPVVLVRTPYDKSRVASVAEQFVDAGYAAVIQDCRGRLESEGVFIPYNNEGQDGYDTIEWLNRQDWCNGRIGMWGASYFGATQWQAAAEKPDGLIAICPTATWTDFYRNLYQGGSIRISMLTSWAARMSQPEGATQPTDWNSVFMRLPLSEVDDQIGWPIPWFENMLTHPRPDGYWHRLELSDEVGELDLAIQHVVGYYDFFSRESVDNFKLMQERASTLSVRKKQQLILGPWDHGTIGRSKVGDYDFGETAVWDRNAANIDWLDRFLKDTSKAKLKAFSPVRYFSMGDNQWYDATSWPPNGVKHTSFYLHSNGNANTRNGDGRLSRKAPRSAQPADEFVSNPADPAPANVFDENREIHQVTFGPVDQSSISDRDDVLVFTSGSLEEDIAFAGNAKARLFVSADTPDADWVVKLIDVHPDGFAQNLVVGVMRGQFRNSELELEPLEPNKVYEIEVDLGPVAATVQKGHELRIDICGAYFPLFDRNTNTGKGPYNGETLISHERVYHSPKQPSRLILPIKR